MKIKIFADGADIEDMLELYRQKSVDGFTTNPTLMRKSGIRNYKSFVAEVLNKIKDLPVSFEVFSDDFDEMYRQAKILKSMGENVYVKIPITNTQGISSCDLIKKLDKEGINLNITAVFTIEQVSSIIDSIDGNTAHIISIFAGRISDTGIDPISTMKTSLAMIKRFSKKIELLWASPREVLNVYQAEEINCDIITIPPEMIKKLCYGGKDLTEFSRETVKMFYDDAKSSGFSL